MTTIVEDGWEEDLSGTFPPGADLSYAVSIVDDDGDFEDPDGSEMALRIADIRGVLLTEAPGVWESITDDDGNPLEQWVFTFPEDAWDALAPDDTRAVDHRAYLIQIRDSAKKILAGPSPFRVRPLTVPLDDL